MARSEIHVSSQGRLVIPAHLRKEAGINPGDVLIGRFENGLLLLERRQDVFARLRNRFREKVPRNVSLVDDLIADRRAEAQKE